MVYYSLTLVEQAFSFFIWGSGGFAKKKKKTQINCLKSIYIVLATVTG